MWIDHFIHNFHFSMINYKLFLKGALGLEVGMRERIQKVTEGMLVVGEFPRPLK